VRSLFHNLQLLVVISVVLFFSSHPVNAAVLRGNVEFSSNKPSVGIEFWLVKLSTEEKHSVVTDGRGQFELNLTQGTYALHVGDPEETLVLLYVELEQDEVRYLEVNLGQEEQQLQGQRISSTERSPQRRRETETQGKPATASTNGIGDLGIQIVKLEESMASETTSLAQLVNPFPAQRRGRWHGSFYEFHRNDNVDSRNFFDPVGEPLPEYKRNQFGASIGTTLSNGLNLLGLYEGLRIIQGSTLLSHVPTTQMKQGDFSSLSHPVLDPLTGNAFPNNRIPEEQIHPVARRLLPMIPNPNRKDADRNFVNNQPLVHNRNWWSFQADHQLTDASRISGRYSLVDGDQEIVHALPGFGWDKVERNQSARISYTHNLTPRFITSFRVRMYRSIDNTLSKNAGSEGLLDSLGIHGLKTLDSSEEGYPEFALAGYASFGDSGSPRTSVRNRYDIEGSVSYSPNNHNFQFEVDFDGSQVNNHRPGASRRGKFSFNGYYSGDAFADFLLGIPDSAHREIGSDRSDLRSDSWQFSFRDNWKVSPKFNFNYGLTYYYFEPYHSIHSNVSTFYPLLFEPPLDGEIVVAGSDRAEELGLGPAGPGGLVFPDRNDFAPRLGLAYSPLGNQQVVFRASYSIYYNGPRSRDFLDHLGRNYPFHFAETSQSPIDEPQLNLSTPFETISPTELRIRSIDPNLRSRYTQYWRLEVQSEFGRHWFVEATYRGNKGTHSTRTLVANVPRPGPGFIQARRPNPNLGLFEILSGGGSFMSHSLALELERRFSDGLSLKSGFTWNRSFSDRYSSTPSNPRNLRAEWAPSSSPIRRVFLNYIYDLPWNDRSPVPWLLGGWRLSGITHIQDGSLFSVTLPGDPNNDGVSGDRPNRIGAGNIGKSERSIDRFFETKDFTLPSQYSFGDSGRNILAGPGFHNWDLSLIKQAPLSGGELVEFRVQLFNAFNHPNFERPDAVFGTSLFGKIFGAHRAREIEIAVKYSF